MPNKFRNFGLGVVLAYLTLGAAHAQQISRTSDLTLTWSGPTFSNASALYTGSNAYGPPPFTDDVYTFTPLSDATNLTFQESGGVTISSPSLTPGSPYASSYPVTFSDSTGALGAWGWTYNTKDVLSYGTLGSLHTLNFSGGGSQSGAFPTSIDFFVYVYLPGDWTTAGTTTGDYYDATVASGFSTPTFSYSGGLNGVTTVFTVNYDYAGTSPDLSFKLIGSAVPEPSTWAMLLLGFAGLGYAGYRKAKSGPAAYVALA